MTRTVDTSYGRYVEQVREASPIGDVVRERLNTRDVAAMYLCAFHVDSKPSMSVNAARGFFHCFGCGASGDVFRFVQLMDGVGFRQSVQTLAKRAGLPDYRPQAADAQQLEWDRALATAVDAVATYYASKLVGDPLRYLTEQRGLPADLCARYRVGWADGGACAYVEAALGPSWLPVLQHAGLAREVRGGMTWMPGVLTHRDYLYERVTFPCLVDGRATFLSGRATQPEQTPKYLHQSGHPAPLYNEPALSPGDVYVTEGPLDALSLLAWDLPAIALQGGMRASALGKLQRVGKLYVCLDNDAAGYAHTLKLAAALGTRVRIVPLPPGQDPNDVYRTGTKAQFLSYVAQAQDPITYGLTRVDPALATTDPVAFSAAVDPMLRLLATRPPLETEAYVASMAARFKWKRPATDAARAQITQHRTVVSCPACGTMLRGVR